MPDQSTSTRIGSYARSVLISHLLGRDAPILESCPDLPHHGLFVTIRTGARLRGCIGTFRSEGPLGGTLQRVVLESAHDSRFLGIPLGVADISLLRLEISLLSAMEPVASADSIDVSRHGIVIEHLDRRGCFLPDVAAECGWDVFTLLSQCCSQKLELPPEAWREPGARLFVFTSEKILA